MTYDQDNIFSTNNEVLIEVCQFISCLMNNLLSSNDNFPIETTAFDSFNAQLIEELREYKVFDC